MISTADTVDAYLAEVPEDRRAALSRLRALCAKHLPGTRESIAYGMPAFHRGEDLVTAFASQKRHIAFYAGATATQRHAEALAGIDCGKGCIRYRGPAAVDFEVVESILADIAQRMGLR